MNDKAFRTFLVVNPRSGGGSTGRRFRRISEHVRAAVGDFDHAFTSKPLDATRLTRTAIEKGYEMIVGVGGDGTFNEVAGGFFDGDKSINPDAVFGMIPRGTGGDLRRTLNIPDNLRGACALLSGKKTRQIDAGHLIFTNHQGSRAERIFINITSIGIGGLVAVHVNRTTKLFGGRISFMLGSARALLEYRDIPVSIQYDDEEPETEPVTCISVCNGQYYGAGMRPAPDALIDDGMFDVTKWVGFRFRDFALHSRMLYDGTHINDPRSTIKRCTRLKAESESTVLLDVDGEQPGRLPAEFKVLPGALRLKC